MSQPNSTDKPVMLITGAAGFIGSAAYRYYRDQFHVIGIDDLSRPTAKVPDGMDFLKEDCGYIEAIYAEYALPVPSVILHLAAQVSVVASLEDPVNDFRRNARATMDMARWAAKLDPKPVFIYASTNKVFGRLESVSASKFFSVADDWPIAPCTPYGISKATGGLYVREFLPDHGYDFRQSCIYGEGQIGSEDQGWIGYIRRQIAEGNPITCYGDGRQIRDLLHVSDLLRAYDLAINRTLRAGSYTVGGGMANSVYFSEAVKFLGGYISEHRDFRKDDQRCFVSRNSGLLSAGWSPLVKAEAWLRGSARVTSQAVQG